MNFALKTAADTVLAYTTGRAGGAPGVVAMATNLSANVYAGCAGVRGLGKPQAMALDSVMAIFSTTKSLTGTAVMQLVEEGRSRLDDAAKIDAPEIAQNQVLTGFDNRRPAEMDTGGHGLYASVGDYMTFIRLFLNDGAGPHGRVLQADTVDAMCRNGLPAGMLSGGWTTPIPSLSNDGEFDPGGPKTWADTFQRNEAPSASGRPAGSISWAGPGWAGLGNLYCWIDRKNGNGGYWGSQSLPFMDAVSYPGYVDFEAAVNRHVPSQGETRGQHHATRSGRPARSGRCARRQAVAAAPHRQSRRCHPLRPPRPACGCRHWTVVTACWACGPAARCCRRPARRCSARAGPR